MFTSSKEFAVKPRWDISHSLDCQKLKIFAQCWWAGELLEVPWRKRDTLTWPAEAKHGITYCKQEGDTHLAPTPSTRVHRAFMSASSRSDLNAYKPVNRKINQGSGKEQLQVMLWDPWPYTYLWPDPETTHGTISVVWEILPKVKVDHRDGNLSCAE